MTLLQTIKSFVTNKIDVKLDISLALQYQKELADAVSFLKAEELTHRKLLCDVLFTKAIEGTNNVVVDDMKVVMVQKFNRTVDKDKVLSLPVAIREKYFKQRYDLDLTNYRTIPMTEFLIIEECLTTTLGAPSLQIQKIKEE